MNRIASIQISTGMAASAAGFMDTAIQCPRSISAGEENDMRSGNGQHTASLGTRILMSLARAKAAIVREPPPGYARGAWAIINDVPYPPPPPYAGSNHHPPSYEDAIEIGVVASPLRVEQLMRRRYASNTQEQELPRIASAPHLARVSSRSPYGEHYNRHSIGVLLSTLPASFEDLPKYTNVDNTLPLSPVVRRWKLGEPAFEKPPLHPKGHKYPSSSNASLN
ncbi:hypothetical protein BX070DRAFT_223186, partial [Coemansia spiralis]